MSLKAEPEPNLFNKSRHKNIGDEADGGNENCKECWEAGIAVLVLGFEKLEKEFFGVTKSRAVLEADDGSDEEKGVVD